ncbi:MAG: ribulose-phosphate 3-epimerase [Candidatus Sumerlaeota bacterium]|nr:ribulose-phosphate 3-epimerase [Candidatus Sumerlaeota bacterium]
MKSDPVEHRYSYEWFFDVLADEGIRHVQLGSFFELYQLPDSFFLSLAESAQERGILISSVFTAHRELGGFFLPGEAWTQVARANFERLIEVAALVGAKAAGSNPGSVWRDHMGVKPQGMANYLAHMKDLMHYAREMGLQWLTIEPMSCLAEPPTLPDETARMCQELAAYHLAHPGDTARVGLCVDIAHGYADASATVVYDGMELLRAALPWTCELHLKNTDKLFNSTFGFSQKERERGVIDVARVRALLEEEAATLPVDSLVGYFEVGGPKLGRDYSDPLLGGQLRTSLQYLKSVFQNRAEAPENTGHDEPNGVRRAWAFYDALEGEYRALVAPSMMCADLANLERDVRRLEAVGADVLHFDIMDGLFVPNHTIGLDVVRAIRPLTALPFDVHLMVSNYDMYLNELARIGVQSVCVHAENCIHLDRTLDLIKAAGARVGVALNPGTPFCVLDCVWEKLGQILVMTVNPGFAGQKLAEYGIRKLAECSRLVEQRGHPILVAVDGNVSFENIPEMVKAGADMLVAGTSSLFRRGGTLKTNMVRLRRAAEKGAETRNREPQYNH